MNISNILSNNNNNNDYYNNEEKRFIVNAECIDTSVPVLLSACTLASK